MANLQIEDLLRVREFGVEEAIYQYVVLADSVNAQRGDEGFFGIRSPENFRVILCAGVFVGCLAPVTLSPI